MVTSKITAVCGVPGSAFPAVKPGAAQALAYAASSVQSAVLGCVVVRVVSTTDCHIAFGPNPTATATSMFLPAKVPEYFICSPTDKAAVIQDTAGGNLSITPAV
jgi:hypothetical protein